MLMVRQHWVQLAGQHGDSGHANTEHSNDGAGCTEASRRHNTPTCRRYQSLWASLPLARERRQKQLR
jgi:hypothetical protein